MGRESHPPWTYCGFNPQCIHMDGGRPPPDSRGWEESPIQLGIYVGLRPPPRPTPSGLRWSLSPAPSWAKNGGSLGKKRKELRGGEWAKAKAPITSPQLVHLALNWPTSIRKNQSMSSKHLLAIRRLGSYYVSVDTGSPVDLHADLGLVCPHQSSPSGRNSTWRVWLKRLLRYRSRRSGSILSNSAHVIHISLDAGRPLHHIR